MTHLPFWEHNKAWGSVFHCFFDETVSVSYLETKAGYCCSRHWHDYRTNGFVVIYGKIRVEIWDDKASFSDKKIAPPDEIHVLIPGDTLTVEAGRLHRFVSLEDSRVIEVYQAHGGSVRLDDINRLDVGGKWDGV